MFCVVNGAEVGSRTLTKTREAATACETGRRIGRKMSGMEFIQCTRVYTDLLIFYSTSPCILTRYFCP